MLDHIEEYLTWLEHNEGRKEATIQKYRSYLLRLVRWAKDQDLNPVELDRDQLELFTGLVAHQQGLSPRTRRPLIAAVRGIYKYLLRQKIISSNPAEDIPYPKTGRKLPVPMDLHSFEKILMQPDISTFIGLRDAALITMMGGCGLRVGGIVSLNVSNLVFSQAAGQEWLFLRVIEKGDKERLVPVPHEARLLVRAYLAHPDLKAIDRLLPDGDSVLWVSLNNRNVKPHEYHGERRRLCIDGVQDLIVKHGTAAGIPRDQLRPHALRHLFGTELAESDVTDTVRQSLMGHADPSSTEVYTHLAMRKLLKTINQANPLAKINTPMTALVKEFTKHGK